MIFGFFSQKRGLEPGPDAVWTTDAARTAGLVAAAAAGLASGASVLLISHFRATDAALKSALKAAGRTFRELSLASSSAGAAALDLARSSPSLAVGLWPDPPAPMEAAIPFESAPGSPAPRLSVLVAEHHPLLTRDQALASFLDDIEAEGTYRFHSSLEEPLFRRFGAENIQALLVNLGMKPDSAVESPYLTRAVRSAQRKIESLAPQAVPAASAQEWFQSNLRD